jgi:mannose-6-phosphate isomerase-like protein (cupin superfamily)
MSEGKRDKSNAEHYFWGEGCEGWRLVDMSELSVIEERMPAGTAEKLHHHKRAQQYFHVLAGELNIDVNGRATRVRAGEGIHISAGQRHKVQNPGPGDARFLLTSVPNTRGDRFDLEP